LLFSAMTFNTAFATRSSISTALELYGVADLGVRVAVGEMQQNSGPRESSVK
jgi:hypothetical protein